MLSCPCPDELVVTLVVTNRRVSESRVTSERWQRVVRESHLVAVCPGCYRRNETDPMPFDHLLPES